ncbi:MAG: ERCC4 domain-containing protein [Deltaproteobacteria bacterium]|nr:ERCC4 domain-containing protein [Deltaproteobacteria bacterium]
MVIDTREPAPHPWPAFWAGVTVRRDGLETGDICLPGNPDVAVERKTPADLVACFGAERQRFERELRRGTHLDRFIVVCSGSVSDVLAHRRGLSASSIIGSLAAWQRRYRIPFVFAGTDAIAADFTLRFLTQPVGEAERLVKAVEAEVTLATHGA